MIRLVVVFVCHNAITPNSTTTECMHTPRWLHAYYYCFFLVARDLAGLLIVYSRVVFASSFRLFSCCSMFRPPRRNVWLIRCAHRLTTCSYVYFELVDWFARFLFWYWTSSEVCTFSFICCNLICVFWLLLLCYAIELLVTFTINLVHRITQLNSCFALISDTKTKYRIERNTNKNWTK